MGKSEKKEKRKREAEEETKRDDDIEMADVSVVEVCPPGMIGFRHRFIKVVFSHQRNRGKRKRMKRIETKW